MIYTMSDLHGEYEKYIKMLNKIHFSDNDIMYIIGDVVDRGKNPVKILKDMSLRNNIYPLAGNHEVMALHILRKLSVDITEKNYSSALDRETMSLFIDWHLNGGDTTLKEFSELDKKERNELINYLGEFSLYEKVQVNNKLFILVHAGLGNFRKDKDLSDYSPDELLYCRFDYSKRYFDDDNIFIITGHTPTFVINNKPEIYKCNNNIDIDCGAVLKNGKLACLCLDTMEEFYV